MNRKGFILIVVVIFLLVAAIASVGLYNAVYLAGKMQGIDEVRRIRRYYAASAGLSYASVILAGSIPTSPISVKTAYPTLYNNLGLAGSEDVAITITAHTGGGYDVTSTCTFSAGSISVTAIVPEPIGGGLPKTGQTTQYSGKADDGYYQMGNPVTPRFTAGTGIETGTVTDNATGLIWEQKTNDGGIHDKDNNYTWTQMFNTFLSGAGGLNTINFAGHNDWRIPNVTELLSIVRYSGSAPYIDPIFTTSPYYTSPGGYLASTTYDPDATATDYMWCVILIDAPASPPVIGGSVVFSPKATGFGAVRAVRGGGGGLH
ncbi:MAG: DUF1566 domain-containing protein [Candidatus Omnitrophica bacterium]|nr:DUF1566 domain-containing protein [Candidatus Omnitrophota bacterium]